MSTERIRVYDGSGWKNSTPSIYAGGWKDVRAVWLYDGTEWQLVAILKAPSAADNTVVAALVGGVFSHEINFSWTSFVEQVYAPGNVYVYLDGVEIAVVGFTAGTNHSENYTLPDAYGTTGGDVTGKVGYAPSTGPIGTLSPASNTVEVVPWL